MVASIEGTVSLPDGRPAIGAQVSRVREGGGMMMGMDGTATDGAGHYRLDGLEAGEQSIQATHDEYPRTVRDLEVKTGDNRLDLAFEGGWRVSGFVRGEDGSPVVGARVDLVVPGRFFGGFGSDTGSDGAFSVEGVSDGHYGVRVSGWKYLVRDPDGREELYDLNADPQELHNLAGDEPERLVQLRNACEQALGDARERAVTPSSGLPDNPEELERLKALGYFGE